MSEIEIWRYSEWSGLYLDGELQVYGDHYHADEWLYQHFNVKIVDDSAWLKDGDSEPYTRLSEVREVVAKRQHDLAEAKRLKSEVEELQARIKRLDPEGRLP